MGYYTSFKLEVLQNEKALPPNWREEIGGLSGYGESFLDSEWTEDCKWYESENNMAEFSRKYPTVLFELEGIGEEQEDHWKAYFLNGQTQRCQAKITFDKFDKKKLKDYKN